MREHAQRLPGDVGHRELVFFGDDLRGGGEPDHVQLLRLVEARHGGADVVGQGDAHMG